MTDLEYILNDLEHTRYHLKQGAAFLDSFPIVGKSGQDAKAMYANVMEMIKACDKYREVLKAEIESRKPPKPDPIISMVRINDIDTSAEESLYVTASTEELNGQIHISFIDKDPALHAERAKLFEALITRQTIPVTLEKAQETDQFVRTLKDFIVI